MIRYYYIRDCKKIGKEDKGEFYLYNPVEGWTEDENSIITDRLIGFDSSKPEDSSSRIGNREIIENIVEITADEVINHLTRRPLDLD